MGIKIRRQQIEDIFLQKEVNLAVKKAREREEKRKKIQGFLYKPLVKKSTKRGRGARINVRRGIKGLWDVI